VFQARNLSLGLQAFLPLTMRTEPLGRFLVAFFVTQAFTCAASAGGAGISRVRTSAKPRPGQTREWRTLDTAPSIA
jgi:hypothetical protein